MATVASPVADQAADLLQNLSLDSKAKMRDTTEVSKKPSSNGWEVPIASFTPSSINRSGTPFIPDYVDPGTWYPSATFYYGGYDGLVSELENYPRYMNRDGAELPPHGVYGDIYNYGYAPYSAYPSPPISPVPTAVGHDGHLYTPQHYQYSTPYYPLQSFSTPSNFSNQSPSSQGFEMSSVSTETVKANPNSFIDGKSNGGGALPHPRSNYYPSSLSSNGAYVRGGVPSSMFTSGFGFDGMRTGTTPWHGGSSFYDGKQRPATLAGTWSSMIPHAGCNFSARNQNVRPAPHYMGSHEPRPTTAPSFMNRMYPNSRFYTQFGTAFRTGLGYGSCAYDPRINSRWSGFVTDCKYKTRGRGFGFYGYGNDHVDGFSELSKGPRFDRSENHKGFGSSISVSLKGQQNSISAVAPSRDQYNKEDFPEKYSNAKFFIIKSYSEDDIHKSVKYNVWASTPNGNKKLDYAYKEAQEKSDGSCPVFLFFSVNTSGHFVGAAEMVGPVDFEKTVDYWQQDKWSGCFPVKWHIVKDVPNGILKHIILESNDNKPVTNSRDTQEVNMEQGLQMLKLFKEHVSKTCILDDFMFYESRERLMQERRRVQNIQKQVKAAVTVDEKEGLDVKIRLQKKPFEVVSILKKEHSSSSLCGFNGSKPSEKNGLENAYTANAMKLHEPPLVNPVIDDGVVNGAS